MISADPRIKVPGSESAARMADYARLFDALHIVVFSRGRVMRVWREARALRGQYDLITAQGADETGLFAYVLSRLNGVPFQLQLHTDVMSPWYRRASWKERARYALARFLIPRASCLRVVSERIKRSLMESGIRNFTPTPKFGVGAGESRIKKKKLARGGTDNQESARSGYKNITRRRIRYFQYFRDRGNGLYGRIHQRLPRKIKIQEI